VVTVALTARWLTRCPRFQVQAKEALRVHGTDSTWVPGFRLHPTHQFWLWLAAASLLLTVALLQSRVMAVGAALTSIAWIGLLLSRVARLRNKERRLAAGLPPDLTHNPFAGQSRACLAWLPVPLTLLAIESVVLVRSVVGHTERDAAADLTAATFLGACAITAALYRIFPRDLALPSLDRWYLSRPLPARALIARVAHRTPPHPSATWRRIPDLSFELNSAGTAIALFGEDASRPIWRRSVRYIQWYFAPVLVPLVAMFATPVLLDAYAQGGLTNTSKLQLGLVAILWLAWALSFFEGAGNQDFLAGQHPNDRRLPKSFADLLRYPDGEVRRVAKEYFRGRGAVVFSLLALSVMPVYFDFLGLFSPAEPVKAESVPAAAAAPATGSASGYAATTPSASAAASATAKPNNRQLLVCGRTGRCEAIMVPMASQPIAR
jgi:hypothetical protein